MVVLLCLNQMQEGMFCGVHYVLLHYSVPGFLGHLSLYLHIDHSMFVSTGSILCVPPEVG